MSDRRSFIAWLGAVAAAVQGPGAPAAGTEPIIEATPTALYQQPDGRNNLVRVTVTGLDAPAARARVTDRRGTLVGPGGLRPSEQRAGLGGEVWVPLAGAGDFQIELEVGKQRVARRRVRLAPGRRWTLYWIASSHTDVGLRDLQERCLDGHRPNLDAAAARRATRPESRVTPV